MRVLSWNLFHGRSVPDRHPSLLDAFAARLAGWTWDVALLQEVPPWWPGPLAQATDADARAVLTSRNFGLAARRWVADRRPDLAKSNGGGANAILVRRAFAPIHRHASEQLCRWPERRWVHAVEVGTRTWVGNVHASTRDDRAQADMARAGAALSRWAGTDALVLLGGDANTTQAGVVPGYTDLGGHAIDRFFTRDDGLRAVSAPTVLDAKPLSDHAPVLIDVS
jgi:endonuclease/exonuclease/phosphatase family metal-dependent hydrolase